MKIGILGAGHIGVALAKKLVKAGHHVQLSNSRGPESLQDTINNIGSNAEAVTNKIAADNEVVILAVRWENTDEVLSELQIELSGKILIDTTNPFIQNKWLFKLPKGVVASEIIESKIPEAKLVKAFNSLYWKWIDADPEVAGGNRVVFVSGDDDHAKEVVIKLISEMKFAPIDLGTLKDGQLAQAGRPLAPTNLILMK